MMTTQERVTFLLGYYARQAAAYEKLANAHLRGGADGLALRNQGIIKSMQEASGKLSELQSLGRLEIRGEVKKLSAALGREATTTLAKVTQIVDEETKAVWVSDELLFGYGTGLKQRATEVANLLNRVRER